MIFHVSFFSISIIFSFCMSSKEAISVDNLAAITRGSDVEALYKKVSPKEPHVIQNIFLDDETKKSICLSMTRNAYFDLYTEEDPAENMSLIYDQLTARVKFEKENNDSLSVYHETVLKENFKIEKNGHLVFTYRSHTISTGREHREYAFPCFARDRDNGKHYLYFISESVYNINLALNVPTSKQIQARFLFAALPSVCMPWILAEEPAVVFAPPEYPTEILEDIYLQMRKFRIEAANEKEDPLCGLNESGQIRTCASVLNSSYFSENVRFNPDPASFYSKCQLEKVSFLSEKAIIKTAGNVPYEKWMMSCSVSSITDPKHKFTYRLSRAHESHYVWVYELNKENNGWNIKNISSKISVVIDDGGLVRETAKILPSNLVDLLIEYRPNTEEETLTNPDELNSTKDYGVFTHESTDVPTP